MRVMICGGTGFIGTALSQALLDRGDEVIIVTRQLPAAPAAGFLYVTWEEWSANPDRWSGVDAIVSLSGETISKRWSDEAKRRILVSRTQTALHLADIVRRMETPPKALVNASGISLYGHSHSPILKKRKKKKRPASRVKAAADLLDQYRNEEAVTANVAGIRGFSAGESTGPDAPLPPRSSRSGQRQSFVQENEAAFIGIEEDSSDDVNELLQQMRMAVREGGESDRDDGFEQAAGSDPAYEATEDHDGDPDRPSDLGARGADSQAAITSSLDYGWFDEDSPASPEDFLGRVVVAWEEAIDQIPIERKVKLRISLVLGREGGSFPLLRLPYRFFIGGRMGKGTQGFPWIHLQDMIGLLLFSLDHPHVSGPLNAVAPDPVNNDQFGRTLGRVMRRGHWLHVPERLLRRVLGEQSVLLLTGQHAYPRRALENGYTFAFSRLEDALRDLTK
ncbi:DUF1731 domain-containing protein [Cohnella lubricantis]|uniref:DUF1731 domain-containing protein n=1 Tax=Cohnella lubricantis TaxID=2163172 RepID=A0A841T6E7_9BACL|nr:DUF1731 domain-containing protein [Cohnella lubricantis]MBB6677113.1 DUF1731 domain-containing protein [Cohnella lubricantis]MBP2118960.1 NAD dependent epimerase/dehydratase family enzyme [Cohnella lubricantis]